MKTEERKFLPEARREGIISKEVEGEVLVYDQDRDKAHCLNPLASAIWKECDGRTTPREIAASVSRQIESPVDEKVVWLGLEELRRTHLLKGPIAKEHWPQTMYGMSRREAIRHIGLGAAITLPMVVSMTSPTAVQAAVSCGVTCKPCNTSADCCGTCLPGPVPGCPPGATPRCS